MKKIIKKMAKGGVKFTPPWRKGGQILLPLPKGGSKNLIPLGRMGKSCSSFSERG